MAKFFMACPECRTRMVRVEEEADGEQRFYVCPDCAKRLTYAPSVEGIAEDWPADVFTRALDAGLVTKAGGVGPAIKHR